MGKHSYAVIFDAGSSGTRVYVYNWKKAEHVNSKDREKLPEIKTDKDWRLKKHPGVSTFADKPELVGSEYLAPLLDFALEIVPKDEIANTPVFLLATAGMRLLPDAQRSELLNRICSYFRQASDFLLPDCDLHVQVIPGETEGLYGWIAANYLLGGFDAPEKHDHGKGHHTYGFLDMGGASAQIAFAPNATETEKHARDLKLLRLRANNGTAMEHKVFVTTWLRFGVNEARLRYVEQLISMYGVGQKLPDPCLPTGLNVNRTGYELPANAPSNDKDVVLTGTGQFLECLKLTTPLLGKAQRCTDPPCLLDGVHTPAIDFDVNHFVGVSEYWHTTHELFAMAHKDRAYDFQTYQKQVIDLCSRDWSDLRADVKKHVWGKKVDEKTVEEVCFKASWLISMLHDGIGIPRVGIEANNDVLHGHANKTKAIVDGAKDSGFLDSFQAIDKIEGTEVSWTLGKIVLYASSQVPADADADAVGFGTNRPGVAIPSDFQYPSSQFNTTVLRPAAGTDEDNDWHRIFGASYSRRVPGILIFLLILALAVYLLCGQKRRTSMWNKFFPSKPGNSRPQLKRRKLANILGANLFGSSTGPAYERVDEDGDQFDMELGDVLPSSSDESQPEDNFSMLSPPRTGRTSGVATPALRGLSPDFARNTAKVKGYFDRAAVPSISIPHGLGISRLAPRSRNTSPSRKTPVSSPYTPHAPFLKASVD